MDSRCSVADCDKRAKYRQTGFCNMHYERNRLGREMYVAPFADRYRGGGKPGRSWYGDPLDPIAAHFEIADSGCWEWTGAKDTSGYGSLGVRGKTWQAHRYAYEIAVEPIPEGLHLDHLCRRRACINPDHLEPVTPRENILRGTSPVARQATKTHCKRGHALTKENCYEAQWPKRRHCRQCQRQTSLASAARRRA